MVVSFLESSAETAGFYSEVFTLCNGSRFSVCTLHFVVNPLMYCHNLVYFLCLELLV